MATYFGESYPLVRLPIPDREDDPGLRRGQLGAIHAIAAHFTQSSESAIVVMPTGSGKTAVLILAAFMLRARRVLVVTPSRLVRQQTAELFGTLSVLQAVGCLPTHVRPPRVLEVKERLNTDQDWQACADYDVVIGTPFSVSPAIAEVATPPADLFDLVLVDEAHHSPASTWTNLLSSFPQARRILFTATPFRRDRKEIKGKIVYYLRVGEAYEDKIFGQIRYVPVAVSATDDPDVAIAVRAEQVLDDDRSAGLRHLVMVRTDTRQRADELLDLYRTHTKLRLELVHGNISARRIKQTLRALGSDELDGIVCVAMLGEGFDFPRLKIAAIHSPHKSLAATLQFIGRFVRTNDEALGTASFVAQISDIEVEAERLYKEDAAWQIIVPDLVEGRIGAEVAVRSSLQTFRLEDNRYEELAFLSLYSFQPAHHVRVFQAETLAPLDTRIKLPQPLTVIHRQVSDELDTIVFLTEETVRPSWIGLPLLDRQDYGLFVVYLDYRSRLLFIGASKRANWLYDAIATQLCQGTHQQISEDELKRVLRGLKNPEFFNVGLRNRVQHANTESYRIVAGGNAHKCITKDLGDAFFTGHLFCKGEDGEDEVTIGYSGSSKIWSISSSNIPGFVEWCRQIAVKLGTEGEVITGCEIDFLASCRVVERVPLGVIAATWEKKVYLEPIRIDYYAPDGQQRRGSLLDFELEVDTEASNDSTILFRLVGPETRLPIRFSAGKRPSFSYVNEGETDPFVQKGLWYRSLIEYLNADPPSFHFAEGSCLTRGRQLWPRNADNLPPFDQERIEVVDWASLKVDTRRERRDIKPGHIGIHQFLRRRLIAEGHDVVLYDDRSGEIADFVVLDRSDGAIHFTLYHCKGTKGRKAGERVGDIYEVVGQAIKSVIWTHKPSRLVNQVRRRVEQGSEFVQGDLSLFAELIQETAVKPTRYEMVIVQPGLSRSQLSRVGGSVLAAANSSLIGAHCEPLRVIGAM